MDVNSLRIAATVITFAAFIGIVFWAMAGRRRADFDAAAQLPLADDASGNTQSGEHQ